MSIADDEGNRIAAMSRTSEFVSVAFQKQAQGVIVTLIVTDVEAYDTVLVGCEVSSRFVAAARYRQERALSCDGLRSVTGVQAMIQGATEVENDVEGRRYRDRGTVSRRDAGGESRWRLFDLRQTVRDQRRHHRDQPPRVERYPRRHREHVLLSEQGSPVYAHGCDTRPLPRSVGRAGGMVTCS